MILLEHNNKKKEEYASIYLIHIILKKDKNNNKDFLIEFFSLFVCNFIELVITINLIFISFIIHIIFYTLKNLMIILIFTDFIRL